MSWENEYKSKLTTAEKAVELIKSGNRVVIGHACAEPSYLVDAMVANAESYHDVEIVHMVAMGKAGYAQPGMESHFRHNALFVGGTTEKQSQRAAVTILRASSTAFHHYLQTEVSRSM